MNALREGALHILEEVPVHVEAIAEVAEMIEARLSPPISAESILRVAWALLDELSATIERKPDCKKGCAFCCTLPVQIADIEAELLANKVRTPERRKQIRDNAVRARKLDEAQYTSALIQCAFLNNDKTCSVYEVRPGACRFWHSLDVQKCMEGFGKPYVDVPLMSNRIVLFKAVVLAAGGIMQSRLGHRAFSRQKRGELHAMVLSVLDKRSGRRR